MKLCLYGTAEWDEIYGIPITPSTAALCRHVTGDKGTLTCLEIRQGRQADWDGAVSFFYTTIGTQGDVRIVRIEQGRVINGGPADNAFPKEWMIPVAATPEGPAKACLRGSKRNVEFVVKNQMGMCSGLDAKSGDSGSIAWNLKGEAIGFVSTSLSIAPITGLTPKESTPKEPEPARTPTIEAVRAAISPQEPRQKAGMTLQEELNQAVQDVLRRRGLL